MKTLYLDIFSGISGDMFIGAMIDLGVDVRALERELEKLKLDGWHIHVARGQKAHIEGVKFDVRLSHEPGLEHTPGDGTTRMHPHSHSHEHQRGHDRDESEHGPHAGPLIDTSLGQVELSVFETNVPPRFRLYFRNAKRKPAALPAADTITLETLRPDKKRQIFRFRRRDAFLEATAELPEPHEFTAILKLRRGSHTEKHQTQFVESHHHHGHGHH